MLTQHLKHYLIMTTSLNIREKMKKYFKKQGFMKEFYAKMCKKILKYRGKIPLFHDAYREIK